VTVTPNVQVEFRWITDVAWFGKVEVFDNPYGTGAPIVTRQSVEASGEAVAATQQNIVVPVGPGSDGKQSRSRDAHAAAVVLHGGRMQRRSPPRPWSRCRSDATGKNYLLISATAINDNGQIVANAWDTQNGGPRAVLLTPIGAVN
jgi:hypothetical protein